MRLSSIRSLALASFSISGAFVAPGSAHAVQINGSGFTQHSHDKFTIPADPVSPFFIGVRDTAANVNYTPAPSNGLAGSIRTPNAPGPALDGPSTLISGTVSIVGSATSAGIDLTPGTADDWLDGNNLPVGVTLSYDVSFTLSSQNGLRLVGTSGNTGNGLGIANNATANTGNLNTGEALLFSVVTTSNHAWTGTPTEPFSFTPISFGTTKFTAFRSGNFDEADQSVTLSDGTKTWGFGQATGTEGSLLLMENNFSQPFSPAGGDVALTFSFGTGASFGLKGFQLSTPVAYDIVANAPTVNADFNNDTVVDGNDFLIWQRNYGITEAALQTQGDADGNGAVDELDLTAWKENFGAGSTPPLAAVPEPASAALAVVGLLGAFAVRKRSLRA